MADFISVQRLQQFFTGLKSIFLGKNDTAKRSSSIPTGKLDSTSTATAMTATVDGITALYGGVAVWLTNGVVTSAAGVTLNINNLGAKPIYASQSAATAVTSIFNINYTALLIYNENRVSGGCWDYVYGYDSNTNTIGYQVRTNTYSLPMDSVTYRYRLLFTSANGTKFVPANNSSSTSATASKTVCQSKIDPFGSIVYYGTTASVAAGSRPSVSSLWQQYGITLGYSFNRTGAALTLTSWKPVYVKCAPQSDGSAIIDSTTPYVQSLPSTEDGFIYIFLGVAYSATAVELTLNHPVYWYKNGMIRPYTNAAMPTAAEVGAIPAPASPSANQELVYVGGAWVAQDKVLVVNCTPTAEDYSGVMDKTVAEIYAAYQAGKRIWMRVYTDTDKYVEAECTMRWEAGEDVTYPSFNTFIINDGTGELIAAYTGARDGGASTDYGTAIFNMNGGVTSVNGYGGDVALDADDVGAVAFNQGSANAGKWLKIDSDGNVYAENLPVYNGGVS